jgi:hypothetical protein
LALKAAKKTLAAAKEHKAKGGKYCICPACTACAAYPEQKSRAAEIKIWGAKFSVAPIF